jgi:hypothetical protein
MADWYYARGGDRRGPIALDELRALAARGELLHDDLVWRDGMAQWARAAERLELFPHADAAAPAMTAPVPLAMPPGSAPIAAPASAASVGTMGYYVPHAGLPPRAHANLRGHAHPSGDVSDWPLDDARVAAFQETVKLRKKVAAAAGLYKLLFALSVIGAVLFLIVFMGLAATSRGAAGPGMVGAIIPFLFTAALGALHGFAWRATTRSHRWAPLTMFILFAIGTGLVLLSAVINAASTTASPVRTGGLEVVSAIIGAVLWGAFALVSWQAFAAIPRYRAQPAWCQELIAGSKI